MRQEKAEWGKYSRRLFPPNVLTDILWQLVGITTNIDSADEDDTLKVIIYVMMLLTQLTTTLYFERQSQRISQKQYLRRQPRQKSKNSRLKKLTSFIQMQRKWKCSKWTAYSGIHDGLKFSSLCLFMLFTCHVNHSRTSRQRLPNFWRLCRRHLIYHTRRSIWPSRLMTNSLKRYTASYYHD